MPFDEAVSLLAPEDWERVVAAVHSREARRAIQMETPKMIWDAGATPRRASSGYGGFCLGGVNALPAGSGKPIVRGPWHRRSWC